jgi:subtilase family serine protease
MRPRTRFLFAVPVLAMGVVGSAAADRQEPAPPRQNGGAQAAQVQPGGRPTPRAVRDSVRVPADRHDLSRPLREIPVVPVEIHVEGPHAPMRLRSIPRATRQPDPVAQTTAPAAVAPPPIFNFEGLGDSDGVLPPDTNGDIGPNHYVQWVNLTFAIYSRTGSLLYGPAAGRTLWSGFGGPCESQNDGDPVVLYDHLADRWIMSQFALPNNIFGILFAPFYQCIAVSQTGDPTGAYYRYQFQFQKLNDYPKFGVWPDAYYMTMNQYTPINLAFAGQGVAAFDRDAMLAGQPASMVYFDLAGVDPHLGGMLPADLDGPPPPAGSPGYFVQMDDDASGYSPDQLQLWKFHVDWTNTSASTFTGPMPLPVAAFDSNLCDYARGCIPQPGTTVKIDALSDRLMYRLQYRNLGAYDSLVVNHTVDVDGSDHAGIRWYEIRNPGGTAVIFQQGTFAPDAMHRWMGSAAMDAAGNIAIAFNVGSSTLAPSIRYAARLATDPPGVLGQGENDLIVGTGSQTHTASRWGDYSMLGVDPVDGCTFWATTEYYAVTSQAGWQTRIGAFKLPGCGTSGPPPAAPANLTAAAATDKRIDLAWSDQSSDELGFAVERCTGTIAACGAAAAFGQVGQAAGNATTYSDGTAQGSTTYTYRVRAVNTNGSSTPSNTAEATTPATPPPPMLTVTASTTKANEGGPTSTSFTISRGTAQISTVTANFTLTGTAANGVDYVSTPLTATIPSNAASVNVTITPIDDATIENEETVVLTLQSNVAYTVGSPSSGTVTIVSDDVMADLVVSSLSVSSAGGAGAPLQVTDTVKNQGSGAAAASVTTFYVSQNFTLDGTDPSIGTRQVPELAAGATQTATTTVTLPDSLTTGTYYIFAKADGPGQVAEVLETNNTRYTTTRVGPDMTMSAIGAPATAGAGSTITVTDTTTNSGGGGAAASTTRFYLSSNVALDASDKPLQSHTVPSLAAGANSAASTFVTIPADTATGSYYLIANADDGKTVDETIETNNANRYVTIRVGGDLTVTSITVPARAAVGGTMTVGDTTANTGSGAVGGSTTAIYLSTNYTLDAGDTRLTPVRAVPALVAGASNAGSTTVTLPATLAPGLWYVIAAADDTDQVDETNEANNTKYSTTLVGPDLIVTALSLPATAPPGGTITVTDTVKNQGAGDAGASTVRYYLSTNTLLDASDVPVTGERAVPGLAPNGTHSGSATLTLPANMSGALFLLAVADGAGAVGESTETNNARAGAVTIK